MQDMTKYFEENTDEFNEVIEELDNYNGFLGDDRYYDMEMLNEFYQGTEPDELLRRAFYGYDEDFTDKDGNHTEPFNPNKDFFRYNGYGNLVSAYYKDYSDHLDDWFIESVIDNANEFYSLPDEITEILEKLEEAEAEELEA